MSVSLIEPDETFLLVRQTLDRGRLLEGVSRVGLAVSGGADSVALAHLLVPLCRERGIAPVILHADHGLREDAAEDARFVAALAREMDVPCVSEALRVAEQPHTGESVEMAARQARLAFFTRQVTAERLDAVATGHQADDVAETVLLRLARGAGASGLAGLRPRSQTAEGLVLIRPLLALTGEALRDWLRARGLAWREDTTNRDERIPRNFVRHTLLPDLERTWQPNLRARLCQSAEALREDDALLEKLARDALAAIVSAEKNLPTDRLLKQPVALQRRILRQWLFGQNAADAAGLTTVLTLLDRCGDSGGWRQQLPGDRSAVCRNGFLHIETPSAPAPGEARLPVPGTLRWGALTLTAERASGVHALARGAGRYPALGSLSAEAVQGRALIVRARRPGDRIAATGLDGSKKIQDLFVDEKIPEAERDRIPLVVCDGDIAWVPGYRVARPFAVPASDAPCIRIAVTQETPP